MHTFMRSTFSTVSLAVNMTPAFSSRGRPLGNASSITRYSASSAFTKGATYVFLLVTMLSVSVKPASSSIFFTLSSGRGVILSIMLQGKET